MNTRQGNGRRQTAAVSTQGYILVGLSVCGLLGLYGIGNSRWQLVAVAVAGSFASLAVCLIVGRLLPRYYGMRLMILSYTVQLVALAAVAAIGLPLSPHNHPFEMNLSDAPFTVVSAILTVPVGALAVAIGWWLFGRTSRHLDGPDSVADTARRRRTYLMIAAVVQWLFWPAALENAGPAGYLIRILTAALVAAPFLAGRDSRGDRALSLVWGLTILVTGGVGVLAGSRSKAFVSAVLFTSGYISALGRRQRLVAGACAMVAVLPLLQLAGVLGIIRGEIGRGGLELVTSGQVQSVSRALSEEIGRSKQDTDVNVEGVGRILSWANVVVPLMTPEAIPYRGLDGFLGEVGQMFRIANVSGTTVEDMLDAGFNNERARVYGFNVSAFTAVEFPMAADAWSRGGAQIALLFSAIAALVLTIGEFAAYRLHRYGAGVSTILALAVVKAAFFDANVYPLLPTLRAMFLNLFALAILVAVVEASRASIRLRRRHSRAPRRMLILPIQVTPE